MYSKHSFAAKVFCWIIAFFPLFSDAYVDIESETSDFIIETKRIEIANHPHAFNPSIVRWKDLLVMSFREIPYPYEIDPEIDSGGISRIGIVLLDENFEPITPAQMLATQDDISSPCRSEDARLIVVGEDLYIVYSDNRNAVVTPGGYRLYIAKLDFNGTFFNLEEITCLKYFDEEDALKREKNWSPFAYEGNLFLSYYVNPHKIYFASLGSEDCPTIAKTEASIDWDFGELRGGTPAIRVDGKYLAFFHSTRDMATIHSAGKSIAHYFMGAYLFCERPPFQVTHVSPKPIVGEGFYSGEVYLPYWKPVRVVFPCGILCNEDYVWVSYGRQDHELWVVKMDKKGLLNSLQEVGGRE